MPASARHTLATAATALLAIASFPVNGSAQQALPLDTIVEGTLTSDGPSIYQFEAKSAGVLTAVVRATGDTDLALAVTDEDGQNLPNGYSDQDLGGSSGAEQIVVTVPTAGRYGVRVQGAFGSASGAFKLGAAFIAFPDLAVAPDPDGRPGLAQALEVGKAIDDSVDPSTGDAWDWFAIKASGAGAVTIVTRADEGDLVLEAFTEGEYGQAAQRSDQDLQGTSGNESVTVLVQAGDTIYCRVSPTFGSGGAIKYRLSVGLVPE